MSELPDPETFGDYSAWPGRAVQGPGGRIGAVHEIYLDDATNRPEWVLVDLEVGMRFVPLAGAKVEGEAIVVAHAPRAVQGAPDFELSKELSQDQERQLYDHYAVPVSEDESSSLLPDPEAEPEPAPEAAAAQAPEPAAKPEPEPVAEPERVAEPVAALPPEGETSEPEDQGPMIPPRPEPVAPPRATQPPPPPPSTEGQGSAGPPPAVVLGGVAAALVLLLFILRRRG